MLQESGKRRLTIRRNMSSSISLPSFRLPSKAKFWKKRRSEDLGDSDPSYRAIYLGNVLTGWAKGKFQMLCIHFQSYFVFTRTYIQQNDYWMSNLTYASTVSTRHIVSF